MRNILITVLLAIALIGPLQGMKTSQHIVYPTPHKNEWVVLHKNVALLRTVYKQLKKLFPKIYKSLKDYSKESIDNKDVLEKLELLAKLESLMYFAKAKEVKILLSYLPQDVTPRDLQQYLKAAIQSEDEFKPKNKPKHKNNKLKVDIPNRTETLSPFRNESGNTHYLVRSPISPQSPSDGCLQQ
jgi:hypothetical protein